MIEVPGETPRFPFTTVAPVLATVEPARTAKVAAVVPSSDGVPADSRLLASPPPG